MLDGNGNLSAELESMGGLHWVGVVSALVSAIIHLVLGLQFVPHWMGFSFLVSTVGFVVGSWLVVANFERLLVYLLGIPFTLGQIAAWIALTRPELIMDLDVTGLNTVEIVDKVAQVLLVLILVVLYLQER